MFMESPFETLLPQGANGDKRCNNYGQTKQQSLRTQPPCHNTIVFFSSAFYRNDFPGLFVNHEFFSIGRSPIDCQPEQFWLRGPSHDDEVIRFCKTDGIRLLPVTSFGFFNDQFKMRTDVFTSEKAPCRSGCSDNVGLPVNDADLPFHFRHCRPFRFGHAGM